MLVPTKQPRFQAATTPNDTPGNNRPVQCQLARNAARSGRQRQQHGADPEANQSDRPGRSPVAMAGFGDSGNHAEMDTAEQQASNKQQPHHHTQGKLHQSD